MARELASEGERWMAAAAKTQQPREDEDEDEDEASEAGRGCCFFARQHQQPTTQVPLALCGQRDVSHLQQQVQSQSSRINQSINQSYSLQTRSTVLEADMPMTCYGTTPSTKRLSPSHPRAACIECRRDRANTASATHSSSSFQALSHALELLYKQRDAAVRHIELLFMHKESALRDPLGFVAKLQSRVRVPVWSRHTHTATHLVFRRD